MRPTTTAPPEAEAAGPTPIEMRHAMGTFASGVTVVSGVDDGDPVGFACQSFASVSLDPPLVLFCADHRGRAWPRIQRKGTFSVSVLGEDQDDLCGRFGSSRGQKFEGLEWRESPWGTPVLPDALLRVHCSVEEVHPAGDHDVVIGRVLALETPDTEARPMIFFRGRFGVDNAQVNVPAPEIWGWGDHWG